MTTHRLMIDTSLARGYGRDRRWRYQCYCGKVGPHRRNPELAGIDGTWHWEIETDAWRVSAPVWIDENTGWHSKVAVQPPLPGPWPAHRP